KVSTGASTSYTPTAGTGAVVGMPWSLGYRPVGSGAAIAYSTSINGCPLSFGSMTAGNTIVVAVALTPATASVTSVSDTRSAYVRRVAANGASTRVEIWTATVATGASTTVTVTASGQTAFNCNGSQYSGAGLGNVTTSQGASGNPSIAL